METLNLSELAEIICEEQADAAAARNIALHAGDRAQTCCCARTRR